MQAAVDQAPQIPSDGQHPVGRHGPVEAGGSGAGAGIGPQIIEPFESVIATYEPQHDGAGYEHGVRPQITVFEVAPLNLVLYIE